MTPPPACRPRASPPPPTWPQPSQPLRGSGAASWGLCGGYRRPRPGPAQRHRPSSPARGAMASLRAERAAGGPRLPATRAGRPAALRLLLLLGGERGALGPGWEAREAHRGGGLDGRDRETGPGCGRVSAVLGRSLAPLR